MALSDNTKDALQDAESALRTALWHAARNERPQTIQLVANLLSELSKLTTVDEILENIDNMKRKGKNLWEDFE